MSGQKGHHMSFLWQWNCQYHPQNSPLGIYSKNKRLCYIVLFLYKICMLLNSFPHPEMIYEKQNIQTTGKNLLVPELKTSRWLILCIGFGLANNITTLRGMQKQFCLKPPLCSSEDLFGFTSWGKNNLMLYRKAEYVGSNGFLSPLHEISSEWLKSVVTARATKQSLMSFHTHIVICLSLHLTTINSILYFATDLKP